MSAQPFGLFALRSFVNYGRQWLLTINFFCIVAVLLPLVSAWLIFY